MRYSIHQLPDGTWELRFNGLTVGTFSDGVGVRGFDLATAALGAQLSSEDGAGSDGALLPETWESVDGIAFSTKLPGGRDFTDCAWSWRDPAKVISPLMLLTTETEYGHLGAELAGFTRAFSLSGGTVNAKGGFYNNDAGIAARDLLLAAAESGVAGFGVSVGPTENVEVDVQEECTEYDEDGFCTAAELSIKFLAYEIGSLTMCAPAGFDTAVIKLAGGAAEAKAQPPVRASLSIPTAPPLEWLTLAEPKPGEPFLDLMGDDVLVEQRDLRSGRTEGWACPLTIRDDGLVYGHLTYWGQCHIGDPWGPGICASASPSRDGYAHFHAGGTKRCQDGTELPIGKLVVGCEHSEAMSIEGVSDHLAHAGMGWASVRVVDGEYGPWICGVLDPGLTEAQVSLLRSLSMSGEWVGELGGILAVNASGLPVQRLAASALAAGMNVPAMALRASRHGGQITKLIGAKAVRRCHECDKRNVSGFAVLRASAPDPILQAVYRMVQQIDARTQHLIPAAAAAAQERLRSTS